MRCPECGRNNPDNVAVCPVCHALASRAPRDEGPQQRVQTTAHASSRPALTGRNFSHRLLSTQGQQPRPHVPGTGRRHPLVPQNHLQPVPHVAGGATSAATSQGDITGRVIAVDGPHQERPPLDICRMLTRLLWLLLLVVSPIIFLRMVLDTLGGFSALIALVGLFFLLRFLSPMNLFAMINLAALFNPARRRDIDAQVPVRYFRIRGMDEETEYIVRMKGSYTHGNVMQDDLISIWGRWRSGILQASRAFNHRTQSWIDLERSASWIGLVITVVIIALLIAYFYQPVDQIFMKLQELPNMGGTH